MAQILLIEDEVELMPGLVRSLKREHEVTTRTTGADGLAELRKNHEQYDLVVLDLMLPLGKPANDEDRIPEMPREKVGEYIFDKMSDICPSIPTVILTAVRSNMQGLRQADNAELMTKPVIMAELLAKIDEMLKQSGGGNK